MVDDLRRAAQDHPIDRFIEKLNLPEMVAGPAGKAISRLVAGFIEIPAAHLDSFAESIKDKTKARTVMSHEVSLAAAKLAAGDTDIVARAAHNLLAKEYRKQNNKEEIARDTIEILRKELPDQPGDKHEPPQEVDADWLNIFERYAEDASTERTQSLWAKVLAGQIRKPNSFSLATLRFLAEVDQKTAELFQKFAGRIFNRDFIAFPPREGNEFAELIELEAAGLFSGQGMLSKKITGHVPAIPLFFGRSVIVVEIDKDVTLNIPAGLLTRTGKELLKITDAQPDLAHLTDAVSRLSKDGVTKIFFFDPTVTPPNQTTLWERQI